jgi:hypothetical protein
MWEVWVCTGLEYQEVLREKYGLPDDWKPDIEEELNDDPTPAEIPHGTDQPDRRSSGGQG